MILSITYLAMSYLHHLHQRHLLKLIKLSPYGYTTNYIVIW